MSQVYLTSPVVGGLGNQLFIISALLNIKRVIGSVSLVIQRSTGDQERPRQWTEFFADCSAIQDALVEKLPDSRWITYSQSQWDMFEDRMASIEQDRRNGISVLYRGYFQNWRYLPPRNYLLDTFKIHEKQAQLNFDGSTTCSVHFRLGDYKSLSHIHPILPDLYYQNAIRAVLQREPNIKTLLIFNEKEDQETVEDRMKTIASCFSGEVIYASYMNLKDWQEMIFMSLCRANVIANSSFSWWGAYFNSYSSPIVIYPSTWLNAESQPVEQSLALPGWIKE